MRARGKRSSCAPTPPANPIPIALVERGRGRGKGRREGGRGGRRRTWNPAPAQCRRLPLRERDSVPSATPALSAIPAPSRLLRPPSGEREGNRGERGREEVVPNPHLICPLPSVRPFLPPSSALHLFPLLCCVDSVLHFLPLLCSAGCLLSVAAMD